MIAISTLTLTWTVTVTMTFRKILTLTVAWTWIVADLESVTLVDAVTASVSEDWEIWDVAI